MKEIAIIVLIHSGIFVLALAIRMWFARIRTGAAGLVLIILPVALSIYRDVDPIAVLVFVVVGLFVLLADVVRSAPVKNRQDVRGG